MSQEPVCSHLWFGAAVCGPGQYLLCDMQINSIHFSLCAGGPLPAPCFGLCEIPERFRDR